MADKPLQVRQATDTDITTVLGRPDRTRGDLHIGGGLRVDGVVRGNIAPNGEGSTLIISESGHVEGDIAVTRARIDGTVNGGLDIQEHLDVTASATIQGDILYGSMSMEAGACIDGTVRSRHAGLDDDADA
jgi:cytoskeletal protein CcmA (bactofilin family)